MGSATVGIKIVLLASNNTPLATAILHRYASVLDEAFDDSWGRSVGRGRAQGRELDPLGN